MPTASHPFVSAYTEGSDPTMLGPNEWNAAHPLSYSGTARSSDYTLATDANGVTTEDVVPVSGTMALAIPSATGSKRPVLVVAHAGTVAVTINRTGSDKIGITDGGFILTQPGDSVALVDEAAGFWSMRYVAAHELHEGATTTATAAGTTTLTIWSKYCQVFTGSTTQTVALPVVSTLPVGWAYMIINASTGVVTVNSSGGNLVATLAPGEQVEATSEVQTGTDATVWNAPIYPKMVSAILGSNFTTSTTTAPQSVAGLALPLAAGATYQFEFNMELGNASTTGARPAINVSAGTPTLEAQVFGSSTGPTAFRADRVVATATIATGTTYAGVASTTSVLRIAGTIVTTSGGACNLTPSLQAGNVAATVTAYAGSSGWAKRILPA